MPITLFDVARKAGVSHTTVAEIVNQGKAHKFLPDTVKQVRTAAAALGYQANHFAKSLKLGTTRMIGITNGGRVSAEAFRNPYLSNVYSGIGSFFMDQDYKLIFHHFREITSPHDIISLARARIVDGLIFVIYSPDVAGFRRDQVPLLNKMDIPYVVAHSLPERMNCHHIGLDTVRAGFLATRHLIEHGYATVGCVGHDFGFPHCDALVAGYKKALRGPGRNKVREQLFRMHGYNFNDGYRFAAQLLKAKTALPRAFFVVDDAMANGMIRKFNEAGLAVPGDVAIVGFGDELNEAVCATALTSIRQPAVDKGLRAARLLARLMRHPRERKRPSAYIYKPTLTIRTTCGCK